MSIMGNRKGSDLPALTPLRAPSGIVGAWRGRFGLQMSEDKFAFAVVIGLILVALQIASLIAPSYIAPPPLEILVSVWQSLTVDAVQIAVTLGRLLAALVFALIAGTMLGIVMGMFPRARPYLRALVLIDTGIPALSWMLVAVFWFKNPEVRIFFIMGVILIPFYALNVFDGVRALPKELLEMSESFRPSRWQIMRFLILPHIVAYVLMTTKSIIGYASRMVVFAELIGAAVGVGARMGMAQATFDMKVVLAWTVILVAFNLIAQQLVAMLETSLLRWRPDVEVR
jgi:NitT/TauT family transport system permease protein